MHLLNRTRGVLYYLEKYKFAGQVQSPRCCATGRTTRPCNSWPEWQKPEGHDTGIKVYNASLKAKVPLITRHPGMLTWYVCGPTVYDSSHIGHGLCYVRFDIIRRILEDYFKLNVVQVTGITDVDDKIIHKAKYFKVDISEVSRYYEAEFLRCMAALGVKPPSLYTHVTDYIDHIVLFVQKILDSGFAYRVADGSVFFNNVAYRKSRGLDLPLEFDDMLSDGVIDGRVNEQTHGGGGGGGATPLPAISEEVLNSLQMSLTDEPARGKRHAIDFALWKSCKDGEPSWPAPFGAGRPGWHIECSAMASAMFGRELDVHSGGIDLKFPHHYCEEAQSCTRHGANMWTNYWWHSGHLTIDREKMSKSIGNVISITDLLESHSANTFRQFVLGAHYTRPVMYRDTTLQTAGAQVSKVQEMLDACHHFIESKTTAATTTRSNSDGCGAGLSLPSSPYMHPLVKELLVTKEAVDRCLRDDFNTPGVMRHLMSLISLTNTYLNMDTGSTNSSTDDTRNNTDFSTESVAETLTGTDIHSTDQTLASSLKEEESCFGETHEDEILSSNISSAAVNNNRKDAGMSSARPCSGPNASPGVAMSIESHSAMGTRTDTATDIETNTGSPNALVPVGRYEITLVRNYILDMMQIFGMNYNTRQLLSYSLVGSENTNKGSNGSANPDVNAKFGDIMKSLLNFRQHIRDFALLKNISKEELSGLSKAEKQALRRDRAPLLQACDDLRDHLAASSVLVKDDKDGARWTFADGISAQKQESDESSKC